MTQALKRTIKRIITHGVTGKNVAKIVITITKGIKIKEIHCKIAIGKDDGMKAKAFSRKHTTSGCGTISKSRQHSQVCKKDKQKAIKMGVVK